jgi:hypothetical protein
MDQLLRPPNTHRAQVEDALYEIESVRRFPGFAVDNDALPDETIYALWVQS